MPHTLLSMLLLSRLKDTNTLRFHKLCTGGAHLKLNRNICIVLFIYFFVYISLLWRQGHEKERTHRAMLFFSFLTHPTIHALTLTWKMGARPTPTYRGENWVQHLLTRGGVERPGSLQPPHVIPPPAPVIAVAQPATMTHPSIIGPDKRANHQHRPDKHYSQMTAYRSVLATVWHITLPLWIQ